MHAIGKGAIKCACAAVLLLAANACMIGWPSEFETACAKDAGLKINRIVRDVDRIFFSAADAREECTFICKYLLWSGTYKEIEVQEISSQSPRRRLKFESSSGLSGLFPSDRNYYRFYLAPYTHPDCKFHYQNSTGRPFFNEVKNSDMLGAGMRQDRREALSNFCIARAKIDAPKALYVYEQDYEWKRLGAGITMSRTRSQVRDVHNSEVLAKFEQITGIETVWPFDGNNQKRCPESGEEFRVQSILVPKPQPD